MSLLSQTYFNPLTGNRGFNRGWTRAANWHTVLTYR